MVVTLLGGLLGWPVGALLGWMVGDLEFGIIIGVFAVGISGAIVGGYIGFKVGERNR